MQEQQAALLPDSFGRRKIVISSAIAETSLTIEGVRIVIDSGLARLNTYDAGKGMNILVTRPVTLDAATQRSGRAGRMMAGHCIRMWAERKPLTEKRKPEILDSDLSPLLLELTRFGVKDAYALSWVTPPPAGALNAAASLLNRLEALDQEGNITEKGKAMLQWPLHPRLAHMLIEGANVLACKLAALIEEPDPLRNPGTADIAARLAILQQSKTQHQRLHQLIHQFEHLLQLQKITACSHKNAGELLAMAFPERIARKKPGSQHTYLLENGQEATLQEADPLSLEEWIIVVNYDASRKGGNIFLAAAIDIQALSEQFKEEDLLYIQEPAGILIAQKAIKLGRHVISGKENQRPDPELVAACWINYLSTNEGQGLDWSDALSQWMGRINLLRRYNPEEAWPELSRKDLIKNASVWLKTPLMKVKNKEQLAKIHLMEYVQQMLPWDLAAKLDELAPTKITVPTGSNISLIYAEDGSSVVLAVRLQEIFGWMKSPEINRGRTKILLHLLSPSYRPAQVTSDLLSFWKTGYHDVRKDLRGRYPKHHWPEDPLHAEPMRGPKKRNP
jgi:ATP-dependent helicase HrpB